MTLRRWLPLGLLALLLLAAAWRGVQVFQPSITTGDEALVALRARGLVEQGHGWTPYWNGAPDVHKPPLYFWLVGIGYKVWGIQLAAVRVPALAAYLVVLALTFVLGRRVAGDWAGLLAALFAALHPTMAVQSSMGMMDSLMIALTLGGAWFLLRTDDSPRFFAGWGLCCGLALLTKGPGAVPILPVSLLYLLVARRSTFRQPWFYAALAGGLVLAGIWFGSQFLLNHDAFVKPYYSDIVGYRLKHSWTDTALYLKSVSYLWASWGGVAPLFFGAFVLPWLWMRGPAARGARDATLLVALAGAVPLVMVSLVRQQMSWYMLPAVPPMAIIAAWLTTRLLQRSAPLTLRLVAGALLAAGVWLPNVYARPTAWPALVCVLAAVSMLAAVGRREAWQRLSGAAFGLGLAAALTGSLSLQNPHVTVMRLRDSSEIRVIAQRLGAVTPTGNPLVVNFRHYKLNSLMFYAHQDSVQLKDFCQQPIAPGARYLGVLAGGECREFLRGLAVESLGEYAGYELVVIQNRGTEPVTPGLPPNVPAGEAADEL